MRVLAIDTSNDICSVAISEDGKIIDELHNEGEREHSQTLMPMINEILKRNNFSLDDIDVLGCGTGPGSFTGIRIGIATVKAFNDAKKIPIVGVDALETQSYLAIMEKGDEDCKIISMIDARNDNAYYGIYRLHNKNLSIYKNPGVAMISNIAGYVNFQENVYVVGNVEMDRIVSYLRAEISEENAQAKETKGYEFVKTNHTFAEAISLLVVDKYNNGLYGDSDSINPMYLNLSQAEKQKQGITDENIYVNEMSNSDREEIERNYDKFKNLWDLKTFEDDAKNSKYYVAKQNNIIIGFISLKTILDEIDIINVVTRIDMRNRGAASSLISYVIRELQAKKINLEVDEKNENAKRLYSKFGFRKVGIRKEYYDGKDDAILMSL